MADINNEITLQASQPIAELNRLDRALDNVNASLTDMKLLGDGELVPSLDDVGKKATSLGAKFRKTFLGIGDGAKKASKDIGGMGLSFKDVARIVQSQVIFGAIQQLKQGFFEAAEAAEEFQLQLARIDAIDKDLTFEGARTAVEELAVTLGRSLDEVGEALFEGLQNDIGDTEKTIALLGKEAQELALVTGGTLPQAVNALSSVLKSYNDEQLKGVDIAGQFFGTINAGRITLKDLESSLGTLSPLASQLGITFTELTNSLATITLTGTKANVATTQLRNVFNKLLKPTKALQAVYDELGVTGFRQLSEQSGGFKQALDKLQQSVAGQEDGLSRLFNTIRANLGVLNVLTKNGELYNETAERSAEASKRLNEEIAKIDATPARVAARQAAELEVVFTQIGDRALDMKIAVQGALLGFIDSGDDAIQQMVGIGTSLTAATVLVKLFGLSFKAALGPIGLFFLAFEGTTFVINQLEALNEEASKLNNTFANFEVGSLKEVEKTIKSINADEIKAADDAFTNVESSLNKIKDAALEAGREIEKAFDIKVKGIENIESELIQRFGDARKRVLDEVADTIKNIDDAIKSGTQNIGDLRQELEDFTFEEGLRNLSEVQQLAERTKRSAELTAKAFSQASTVGLSKESEAAAKATAEMAVSAAKATLAAAKRVGSETEIAKAVAGVQEAITSQIAVERELRRKREEFSTTDLIAREQKLKELAAQEKQQILEALQARKAVEDAIKSGEDGSFINGLADEADREAKEAIAAIKSVEGQKLLSDFGLTEQFQSASKKLFQGLSQTHVDWTVAINDLQEQLANDPDLTAAVDLKADIDAAAVSNEIKRALAFADAKGGNAGEQVENSADAIKKVAEEQTALADKVEESAAAVKTQSAEALGFLKEASEFGIADGQAGADLAKILTEPTITALEGIGTKSEEELVKLQSGLVEAFQAVEETSSGFLGEIGEARKNELVQGLTEAIGAVGSQLDLLRAKDLFKPEVLAEANGMLDKLNAVGEEEIVFDVDDEGIKQANRQLALTKISADAAALSTLTIGTSATKAVPGVKSLSSTTGSLVGQAKAASEAFKQLLADIKAAIDAAKNAPSGPPSFFGGMQYRASGGTSGGRGQDTISTMLSPGEFVTNSKQTANFLPELQAINAGNSVGGGSGGSDTNITIGDINVTSNSEVGSQTGRDIGNSLKRELRRGTLRL